MDSDNDFHRKLNEGVTVKIVIPPHIEELVKWMDE